MAIFWYPYLEILSRWSLPPLVDGIGATKCVSGITYSLNDYDNVSFPFLIEAYRVWYIIFVSSFPTNTNQLLDEYHPLSFESNDDPSNFCSKIGWLSEINIDFILFTLEEKSLQKRKKRCMDENVKNSFEEKIFLKRREWNVTIER